VTGDERFDEVVPGDAIFTYPLVIKRGAKTKLVDVTAKFPDQIKAQIAEVRKQVDAGTASETTLATLIADLSRLGDTVGAKAVVDAAFDHNELNTKLAKELGQQLKTWGYVADPAAIGLGG
jgi:hypothetical protein